MVICCSKKAAQRQKEYEEEVRMRKLEEAARQEQEHREREEMRKAEIERIMQEEKQTQELKRLASEKARKERKAQEEAELERKRQQEEKVKVESARSAAEQKPLSRRSTGRTSSIASTSQRSGREEHAEAADESFEMQTYTPFNMTAVDQTARYMATKCGCAMQPSHKPSDCPICSAIDLSDAPLIA